MKINEKKFSFIICVNNELYFDECLYYIKHLRLPVGFEMDIIPIRAAASITAAYNQAMQESNAKYKIYMHQDMFLINHNILLELYRLFSGDPLRGMIGLIGASYLPLDGVMYRAWNCGNVYASTGEKAFINCLSQTEQEVVAVDGMFIATQYDIPWREDVIRNWDFYDISQSFEFQKSGYKLFVPAQDKPWSFHDCGNLKLTSYDAEKENFWAAYQIHLDKQVEAVEVYSQHYKEYYLLMMELKEQLKLMILHREFEKAAVILRRSYDSRFADMELAVMRQYFLIYEAEKSTAEIGSRITDFFFIWDEFYHFYHKIKFLLRRIEFQIEAGNQEELHTLMERYPISKQAIEVIVEHAMIEKQFVLDACIESL